METVTLNEKILGALEEISEAMSSSYELDELLLIVVETVTTLMDAERSTVYLVDKEHKEIWSVIAQGSDINEIRLPIGKGLAGWVAEHGTPMVIHDAYQDPRFDRSVDGKTGFVTRSVLVQPMFDKDGDVMGVIQVLNKRSGTFTSDDQRLLAIIAQETATGLTLSKLYSEALWRNKELEEIRQKLEDKIAELNVLYEIERAVSSSSNFEALVESVLEHTVKLIKADAGSVLMKEGTKNELYFLSAVGKRKEAVKRLKIKLGEGIIGLVAEHGEPIISNSPETDPRHAVNIADKLNYMLNSALCVPLFANEEIMGAIELLNKEGGFTDDDMKLLTLISGQVGRAFRTFTDRSKREEQKRFADIGQMLSAVLHDIKTPMTIISGYVQLMTMEDEPQKRAEYSQETLKQFDLMNRMTREILAFVKGKHTILPVKVMLGDFVKELSKNLTPEFAANGVLIRVEAEYRNDARFDPDKMKRVVYNIARNALEAMPDGGEFVWKISNSGANLIFVFSDTGVGIPPEIREKLSTPLVSHGKLEGTGLGLAIVRQIVEEHSGEMVIDSEVGKGTTITIKLPILTA